MSRTLDGALMRSLELCGKIKTWVGYLFVAAAKFSKIRARSTGHQAFDCAAGYLESNYQDWEDEWDKGHDSQLFEGMTFGSNVMFPWFSRNLVGGKKLISETGECEDLLESKFVLDRGYKAGVEDCEDRFLCAEDLRLRTRICRGIWRRMTGRCD
ncbi:hypothetical protein BDZ45DRAFT_736344 [Acephala macrosclerotiorum]|nr:hypothetical protein BDZ45DRAFT_736344 [Acephala macrosclerotiorum]